MSMTPLPAAPNRASSPDVFDAEVDAFLSALPGFVTEANALEAAVDADKTAAAASATAAATSATAAATSATAAAASATSASGSATTATTQATAAAASATAAAGSATAAAASAADAVATPVAAPTHSAPSKATPVDADEIPLADSAASFGLKKLTWANLKAAIRAYFESGNVAFGATVLAAARLYVKGSTTDATAYGLYVTDSAGTERFTQKNDGTTALTGTLAVDATTATLAATFNSTHANGGYLALKNSGTAKHYFGSWNTLIGSGSKDDTVVMAAGKLGLAYSGGTIGGTLDTSGNFGLGVTPEAWYSSAKVLRVGGQGSVWYYGSGTYLGNNYYLNTSGQDRYIGNGVAQLLSMPAAGGFAFSTAGSNSGGAGAAMTLSQSMGLDGNGRLTVQQLASGYIAQLKDASGNMHSGFYVGAGGINTGYNGSAAGLWLAKDVNTNRSLNGAGTINASGADYAEYEKRGVDCPIIDKGQVVGFDASGLLTLTFTDAVRFGIKSTTPSYVGGDTWGSEDVVGKRPEEPIYTEPRFDGAPHPGEEPLPPVLVLPEPPEQQEGESDQSFEVRVAQWQQYAAGVKQAHAASVEAYEAALLAYQSAFAKHRIDEQAFAALVEQAKAHHDNMVELYRQQLAVWEAKLEAERQKVDRIAYSGKVPVNVTGATPGGYIVAAAGQDGEIVGQFVVDPTFTQYKRAVGRVNRLLADGRCEVAVIVH